MTVAIVVQARTGSTRLPGKVLLPFGESTLLATMLDRLAPLSERAQLWVATSDLPADDAVVDAAAAAGARVARGSALDVLERFRVCVEAMPERPELIVRMCADRPFASGGLIAEMLDEHPLHGAPDYLSNTLVKSWPDGLDVEIVRTDALLAAAAEAEDAYEREHVTPFIYRRPERFDVVNVTCPFGNFSDIRAVIDTADDRAALLEAERRLRAIRPDHDHLDLLNLAAADPDLFPSKAPAAR